MHFMAMPHRGGRYFTIMKMITLCLEGISGMEEEGLCDGEEAQKGLNYYYVLKVNL